MDNKIKCCSNMNKYLGIVYKQPKCFFTLCCFLDCYKEINNYDELLNERNNVILNSLCKHQFFSCPQIFKVEDVQKDFKPALLNISIFNSCNLDCYYCFYHDYRKQTIDFENIKIFCEDIENKIIKNAKKITWSAGEFYHDKKLQEIYSNWKKKYNISLEILTNGVNYDPRIDVDDIILTLHGFNKESYIQNCGRDVFESVKNNIKRYNFKLKQVILMMNWYNACHVEEFAKFIKDNIPKNIQIQITSCKNDTRKENKFLVRKAERKLEKLLRKEYHYITKFTET